MHVPRPLRPLAVAAALLALAACQMTGGADGPACLLPGQTPMVVAELFFGRAPLTEDAWRGFAAEVVTREFPAGFTSWDGDGQWRDPETGALSREPAKILLVAAAPSADLAERLRAVIDAYRARFGQKSVGVITRTDCGRF